MKKNATLLAAEITVSYSANRKLHEMPKLTSSKTTVDVLRDIWSNEIEFREASYLLLLNRANYLLGWFLNGIGGVSGTVVDPRIIFSTALKCHASSIILAHNHPSGNNQPSAADIQLTKKISEAGKLLEITLLDHIILTKDQY